MRRSRRPFVFVTALAYPASECACQKIPAYSCAIPTNPFEPWVNFRGTWLPCRAEHGCVV